MKVCISLSFVICNEESDGMQSFHEVAHMGSLDILSVEESDDFHAVSLPILKLFVTLASSKLLALGKAQINLALLSFFRNFADVIESQPSLGFRQPMASEGKEAPCAYSGSA